MKILISALLSILYYSAPLFACAYQSNPTFIRDSSMESFEMTLDKFCSKKGNLANSPKIKKREIRKIIKNEIRRYSSGPNYSGLIFVSLFSVLLPPIGVLMAEKRVGWRFWVTIFLTLLFWLPGVIFALLVTFENFCDCF